jgi:hypothetical protein
MKTVYIIGPFRNDPELNVLKFEKANLVLWRHGFFGFNPVANCYPMGGKFTEDEFARRDVEALKKLRFDAVFALDGWKGSKGAMQEFTAAQEVGIPVFESLEALCQWRDESEHG